MSSGKPNTFLEQNIIFRQQIHPSLSIGDPFPIMDLGEHYQLLALWRDYSCFRIAFPKSMQFAEAISYFVDAQCPYFRPQPSPLLLRRATDRLDRIWREDLEDRLPLNVLKSSTEAMEDASKRLREWSAIDPESDEARQQEMFDLLSDGDRYFLWHAPQHDMDASLVNNGLIHRAVVNEIDGLLASFDALMTDTVSSFQLSAIYTRMSGDRDRTTMKFSNDQIRMQRPICEALPRLKKFIKPRSSDA